MLGGTVLYVQRVSALGHLGDAADTITDTSKAVGSPLQGDIAATCKNTAAPQAAASRLQAFLYIYVYVSIYVSIYVSMYLMMMMMMSFICSCRNKK